MTMSPPRHEAAQSLISERLNDPKVAASLAVLLDHADLIAVLVEALDGFVARSEVISDSLASSVGELRAAVANSGALDEAETNIAQLVDTTKAILASDLLKPESLNQLSVLARGLGKGGQRYEAAPVAVGGIFSLGRLLKDPDIKRAISYGATLAKAVGAELNAAPSTTPKSS